MTAPRKRASDAADPALRGAVPPRLGRGARRPNRDPAWTGPFECDAEPPALDEWSPESATVQRSAPLPGRVNGCSPAETARSASGSVRDERRVGPPWRGCCRVPAPSPRSSPDRRPRTRLNPKDGTAELERGAGPLAGRRLAQTTISVRYRRPARHSAERRASRVVRARAFLHPPEAATKVEHDRLRTTCDRHRTDPVAGPNLTDDWPLETAGGSRHIE